MKKSIFPVITLVILIACSFAFFQALDWKISDNYSVKFDGRDPAGGRPAAGRQVQARLRGALNGT